MGLFNKDKDAEEAALARKLAKENDAVYHNTHKPGRQRYSSGTDTDPVFVRQIEVIGGNILNAFLELNSAQLGAINAKKVLPKEVDIHFVYIADERDVILITDLLRGAVRSRTPFIGTVTASIEYPVAPYKAWPYVVRAWISAAYYPNGSVWNNPNAQNEGKMLGAEMLEHWKARKRMY